MSEPEPYTDEEIESYYDMDYEWDEYDYDYDCTHLYPEAVEVDGVDWLVCLSCGYTVGEAGYDVE